MDKYYFDARTKAVWPAPGDDIVAYATWFETADRKVAQTTIDAHTEVSTVFLGYDHGWGGVPELFETMVFCTDDDTLDGECWRYQSYASAEAGHQHAVQRVKEKRSADAWA